MDTPSKHCQHAPAGKKHNADARANLTAPHPEGTQSHHSFHFLGSLNGQQQQRGTHSSMHPAATDRRHEKTLSQNEGEQRLYGPEGLGPKLCSRPRAAPSGNESLIFLPHRGLAHSGHDVLLLRCSLSGHKRLSSFFRIAGRPTPGTMRFPCGDPTPGTGGFLSHCVVSHSGHSTLLLR